MKRKGQRNPSWQNVNNQVWGGYSKTKCLRWLTRYFFWTGTCEVYAMNVVVSLSETVDDLGDEMHCLQTITIGLARPTSLGN